MNFKKLIAGIAVGAMVMGSGVAAFAGNGILADDEKTVQFYAQYDDGHWAAAPYDMNDANIAEAYAEDDGTYTLILQEGAYTTPVATKGQIKTVVDANGKIVSVDADGDGYADYVNMATGESNKYTLNLQAKMGLIGHEMDKQVYLVAE